MFSTEFHQIPLDSFRELPPELWSEEFFRANESMNAFVFRLSLEVVDAVGSEAAGIQPDRTSAWRWLLRQAARARDSSLSSDELRRSILSENPSLAPALDLSDAARKGYPDFLRGIRDGNSILFDPLHPSLWERYFHNQNPLCRAGNVLATHAASQAALRFPPRRMLRVLEVGTGLGSAAKALLEGLGSSIASYVATDISPGFLRKARERIEACRAGSPGELGFQLLDLNRPRSWPVRGKSFDLIYAVNVLHAVYDLQETLSGLKGLLGKEGILILGECIRPARGHPVHPEFVFQLLDEFRIVRLDPETRPEPGFLDASSWRASLLKAGFASVQFFPDFEAAVQAYPEPSMGAMVAKP